MLKELVTLSYFLVSGSAIAPPETPAQPTTAALSTCAEKNAAVAFAQPADLPPLARIMNITGSTYVQIDLAPSGALAGASVLRSSGYGLLDRAALQATRGSRFQAAEHNCSAVGGSYVFAVDFDS
jgi:protein TonB